ncbi:MAG: DNA methyltransferase [Candidatus Stygibacter frigidus]|nr:DNA methyltransferase [Candidatus Stygibacter frigidus]
MTKHKIFLNDSRNMSALESNTINLVITSPPYWQLKDYGNSQQIGFNDSYEDYINNLNLVWQECNRVLKQGCRLCINIGDQFARAVYYGRYKVIPIRTEIIRFCETIGLDYMGAIIWQKVTNTNTSGGATIMGSFPYPRNGILKLDYEFILIFKKPGKEKEKISKELKEKSKMTKDEWNEYFRGHWNFSGARQDKHLAMFPEELPRRLIKMFSFVDDTILDPFLGSGTTALAAKNLERNSVGYEINPEFEAIIKKKIGWDEPDIFRSFELEVINGSPSSENNVNLIENLPYRFKDPIKLDKKINPKKMNFGSKIDNTDPEKTPYYSVRKIISPTIWLLNNNQIIRLIGLREQSDRNFEAMEYLKSKLSGQKIFLRFDDIKHDEKNNLLCYAYLKNKTFINAHLIKERLVEVDSNIPFTYKSKFNRLRRENG